MVYSIRLVCSDKQSSQGDSFTLSGNGRCTTGWIQMVSLVRPWDSLRDLCLFSLGQSASYSLHVEMSEVEEPLNPQGTLLELSRPTKPKPPNTCHRRFFLFLTFAWGLTPWLMVNACWNEVRLT